MQQESILDKIYDYVGRFISYPNESARIAHVAWITHTYLLDAFYATPRMAILSPEKRSGKTRLLEITKLLVQNPKGRIAPSSSSIFTEIELSEITPTFLIDEIGRLLEQKDIGEFLSIVEAGFQPGQTVSRVTLNPVRKVEYFEVYAPMLMAGIDNGRMPDTILDRSITIRMKRNIGKKLSYRPRKHAEEGKSLAAELAEWARKALEKAGDVEPIMPDDLNDREQDKWEPLFIVGRLADLSVADATVAAGVAGIPGYSGWEDKIRAAALELSSEDKETETSSNGEILLKDIRQIFDGELYSIEKIKTAELLDKLNHLDESPWSTYLYGKPLSAKALAKILKPYGIKPKQLRVGHSNERGYYKSQFEDPWTRYLLQAETPATGATSATRAAVMAIKPQELFF